MNQDVKIKVTLDTAQARADLESLTRSAQVSGGRVGDGIRSAAGRGFSINNIPGVGEIRNAVTGPTSNGISDIVGEAFGGWGVQIERWLFGDMGPEARASEQARAQMSEAFSWQMGSGGGASTHAAAKQYYDNTARMLTVRELGRQKIEGDKDFRAFEPKDLLDKIAAKFTELLHSAADYLLSKIPVVKHMV